MSTTLMSVMPTMSTLEYDGVRKLTIEDLAASARPISVEMTPDTQRKAEECESFVFEYAATGGAVYGLTTGFGPLVQFSGREDPGDHGRGLVDFLRAGQGDPLEPELVRAMLLARVWALLAGRSGVGTGVIKALTAALKTPLAPTVPELGSVGASGDLTPLAHAVGVLMGDGQAHIGSDHLPASEALKRCGLAPLVLHGRDALGLVNGTSLTAATAGLTVYAARAAVRAAVCLSALMVETLGARSDFADVDLLAASGHDTAVSVCRWLLSSLEGATVSGERPLQEPYSVRCVPQLVGAVEMTVRHAHDVVSADLNGVSDNPLFFPELGKVVHGGNFFGQPVAFVSDLLNIALVQLGNLAERQLDLLTDPHRNTGLPPLLAPDPGRQHGLTGVGISTTAIVAAMRRAATPASMQSLPTNLHNQDIVPFGTQAALEAYRQAKRLRWIQGALALALRQAAHCGARRPTATANIRLLDALSDAIPAVEPDRPLSADVERAISVVGTHAAGLNWDA